MKTLMTTLLLTLLLSIQAFAKIPDAWTDFVIMSLSIVSSRLKSGELKSTQLHAYNVRAERLSKDIPKMKKIIEADWKNTNGLFSISYFCDISAEKAADIQLDLWSIGRYYSDSDFTFKDKEGLVVQELDKLVQGKRIEMILKSHERELFRFEKDFMAFAEELHEKYIAIYAYKILKNLGY